MTVEININEHTQGPIGLPIEQRLQRVDIGDGLVMRWSTRKDANDVADCLAEAFKFGPIGTAVNETEEPKPSEMARAAIKRLLRGNHGCMTEYDYAVVENTLAKEGQNPIVTCICLQTAAGYYGKVLMRFGKPECVGTHPDYRGKGLVRRLFLEFIHPATDGRGDVIQLIPGISHFYRQFGYEYAVNFLNQARVIENVTTVIPELDHSKKKKTNSSSSSSKDKKTEKEKEEDEEKDPFTLRQPTLKDLSYLLKMSTRERLQSKAQLGTLYDEVYWKYTIHDSINSQEGVWDFPRVTRIIVDAKTGQDCGLVVMGSRTRIVVPIFTLEPGYYYREALYPVLRQMFEIIDTPSKWDLEDLEKKKAEKAEKKRLEREKAEKERAEAGASKENGNGEEEGKEKEDDKDDEEPKLSKVTNMLLCMDPTHPVFKLLESRTKKFANHYRLYTRILSYAKFIQTVAPELEDRLENSCMAGITVTWQMNFFRKVLGSSGQGLEIVFKEGKIVSVSDSFKPLSQEDEYKAAKERIAKAKAEGRKDKKPLVFKAGFAPLSFTRLLVGDLSVDEMLEFYGEFYIRGGQNEEAKMMLEILFPKQSFACDIFWW